MVKTLYISFQYSEISIFNCLKVTFWNNNNGMYLNVILSRLARVTTIPKLPIAGQMVSRQIFTSFLTKVDVRTTLFCKSTLNPKQNKIKLFLRQFMLSYKVSKKQGLSWNNLLGKGVDFLKLNLLILLALSLPVPCWRVIMLN